MNSIDTFPGLHYHTSHVVRCMACNHGITVPHSEPQTEEFVME